MHVSDESTPSNPEEPSAESLAEMPEVDLGRKRVLGRGRHVHRKTGKRAVYVDEAIASRFDGDGEIEEAVRALLAAADHVRKTG
jgi:hypothetical protein